MFKLLKTRLSALEEKTKPRDPLANVRFMVTFADGSKRMMDARDLFSYALLRDFAVAARGVEPGTVLEDDKGTPIAYTDFQILRGSMRELPRCVSDEISVIKGV